MLEGADEYEGEEIDELLCEVALRCAKAGLVLPREEREGCLVDAIRRVRAVQLTQSTWRVSWKSVGYASRVSLGVSSPGRLPI